MSIKFARLFHKLSHFYMFRHYRVILRDHVINTFPRYTSISNAPVGDTIYNYDFQIGFIQILILYSLKSQYYKIFKHQNCPIYYKMGYNHFVAIVLVKSVCMVAVYTFCMLMLLSCCFRTSSTK